MNTMPCGCPKTRTPSQDALHLLLHVPLPALCPKHGFLSFTCPACVEEIDAKIRDALQKASAQMDQHLYATMPGYYL